MPEPLHSVLWQNKRDQSLEYGSLHKTHDGFALTGTVLLSVEQQPARVEYRVTVDAAWQTNRATVDIHVGSAHHEITLTVDGERRWWHNREEIVDCRGCVDVDLGFTPATNTLPIRRLDFASRASQDTTAAWLRFPELTVEPLPQRYTRLSPGRYRYESIKHGFRAELEVDTQGLVTRYRRALAANCGDTTAGQVAVAHDQ